VYAFDLRPLFPESLPGPSSGFDLLYLPALASTTPPASRGEVKVVNAKDISEAPAEARAFVFTDWKPEFAAPLLARPSVELILCRWEPGSKLLTPETASQLSKARGLRTIHFVAGGEAKFSFGEEVESPLKNPEVLRHFSRVKTLTRVIFAQGWMVDGATLRQLCEFENLESLAIGGYLTGQWGNTAGAGATDTDVALKEFAERSSRLHTLELRGNPNAEFFKALAASKSLKTLCLALNSEAHAFEPGCLRGIKPLCCLELSGLMPTASQLDTLLVHDQLRVLSLTQDYRNSSRDLCKVLASKMSLRCVVLKSDIGARPEGKVSLEGLAELAKHPHLEELALCGQTELLSGGEVGLSRFPVLRALHLHASRVSTQVLAELAKCKRLEEVSLTRVSGPLDSILEALGRVTSLRGVCVERYPSFDDRNTKGEQWGVGSLKGLLPLKEQITSLLLYGIEFIDASALEDLKALTKLRTLALWGKPSISGEAIKVLSKLTELRELLLSGTVDPDAYATLLSTTTSLKKLVVTRRDAALLPNLRKQFPKVELDMY